MNRLALAREAAVTKQVRKRCARAWNDGRTALETEPRGKAADEMRGLWAYVGEAIGLIATPKKEKQYA